jgi:hypothetical protein
LAFRAVEILKLFNEQLFQGGDGGHRFCSRDEVISDERFP